MLQGVVNVIERGTDSYRSLAQRYQSRFPSSAMTFALADFTLYALTPDRGRLVAGFGAAFNIGARTLRELAAST